MMNANNKNHVKTMLQKFDQVKTQLADSQELA